MIYGILVAGGQGTRIGFRKQYADLCGKPVWSRSADALLAGGIAKVWLVVPADDVHAVQERVEVQQRSTVLQVVSGGDSRFQSVRNGLAALFRDTPADELPTHIAVHDAARPLVLPEDVQRVIDAAVQYGGAILATPSPDTVKRVRDGQIETTVPRADVWLAQTPQVFDRTWMEKEYAKDWPADQITDDASVFEQAGYPVMVVPARGDNRKITTINDLEYATWVAERRWGGANDE